METGAPERSFGTQFRATRLLRRTEGFETLAGTDVVRGSDVILKVVAAQALTSAMRARLEHEAAALNQLEEPSLIPPICVQAGGEDALVVVARPTIAGKSLEEQLQQAALAVRETIALGVRVLSTLARVHACGVLHRNIKPSNIILSDGRPEKAVLVDFGLARPPGPLDTLDERALRDARYLAPEQLGLIRRGVDARSDLYATGAVLYEALTLTPAFVGRAPGELLRAHLTGRPAPLNERVPGIPTVLVRILERLMRKDPRDRYHTAAGALADLEQLAQALDRGVEPPALVVGAADTRRVVTEPAFIVRAELWKLASARAEAQAGSGVLVVVEAESGGGKTWLLDEVSRQTTPVGVRVLRSAGVGQGAQHPYQMLSGIVREAISAARTDTQFKERLVRALGPLADAACAALPELRSIFPDAKPDTAGPDAYGETRGFAALSVLVDALGSREQPALLLLDDAQWADEPTVRLLDRWQAERASQPRHVTVILALRPEDVAPEHPLNTLRARQRIRLRPFTADDMRNQLASMAGKLPEEAIQTIVRTAGGNPFLVSAALHGLVDVGALVSAPGGWRFDPSAAPQLQASERAGAILAMRLAKLDDRTRQLLTLGAVVGSSFDPVFAGSLADFEPREAIRLAEACAGNIVCEESAAGSFGFIHDKVREALLAQLTPTDRERLHLAAAERIEREDRTRAFDLAYHFDAAGRPQQAFEHALSAAEEARARFDLGLAERYYRIAERGAGDAARRTRLRVAKALAEVLTLRSRYEEAQTYYERALELCQDARERAQVEERWGAMEMKRGDMRAACLHCESALRLMGRLVPRSKFGCVLWSVWELLVQILHTYLPRVFVGRRSLAGAEDELFVIRVFHGLNGPYFFSRGVEWAGWAHLRLINLAERYPPCLELGRAYAAHAVCLNGFPGLFERGLRISKAGADLCEQLGDPWGQAQGLSFHAMMLHYTGRFAESYEVGLRASALFDRTGDRWEANTGLDFAVDSLFRMGEMAEAVRLARRIWERGHEIGDSHALAWSLDAWSRATDGRGVPEDLIAVERARSDHFVQTSVALDQAEGLRLLGAGRPREAAAVLEAARKFNLEQAGFFYDLNAPILVYLVAAYREQAEATPPWNPRERERLLALAKRADRHSMAISRKFQNNLAHALRESAYVAAMTGDGARARTYLEESLSVAEARGQRYERALSLEAFGRLGEALGWEGAAGKRERGEAEIRTIRSALAPEIQSERRVPSGPTLALADRFATLLSAGRALVTALEPEAVFSELQHAALALLRAERCVILAAASRGEGLEFTPTHGDAGLPVSGELVRRAMAGQHAITFPSGAADPGLRRAATRSVLCAPIVVRGDAWGCIYVVHGEVDELFGEEERRIGEFLGTLAGAALENAHGFREVQDFSRMLETRVTERTAELGRANRELEENLRHLHAAQEQLVQAGKMAAVGTLVAGLSHELNNPLAVILGYAHTLLQQVPEGAPTHKPLAAIERHAKRSSQLVHALLGFVRATASRRERVRIAQLCDSVTQLIAGTAAAREVRIETHLDEGAPPELVVCPQEIESALLNLLSNAVDASPAGAAVSVRVRASTLDDTPGIELAVHDAGPGIPPEIVARMFDPFFTTKPVGRGTGLGLSITRQIVHAHGGRIDVQTSAGQGTRMILWLPLGGEEEVPS